MPVLTQPADASFDDWVAMHDAAQALLDQVAEPVRLEAGVGSETLVTEYFPLTGEVRTSGTIVDRVPEHSPYDGPFTAPRPSGPSAPDPALVVAVPLLPETLGTAEPSLSLPYDHSWRCGRPLNKSAYLSHWLDDWANPDTELVANAWTAREWDATIRAAIEEFSYFWPVKVGSTIYVRHPDAVDALAAAHESDPRFRRKQEAHRARWVDTALHVGLHELYRTRAVWPDPDAMPCGICGRVFAPETLNPFSSVVAALRTSPLLPVVHHARVPGPAWTGIGGLRP